MSCQFQQISDFIRIYNDNADGCQRHIDLQLSHGEIPHCGSKRKIRFKCHRHISHCLFSSEASSSQLLATCVVDYSSGNNCFLIWTLPPVDVAQADFYSCPPDRPKWKVCVQLCCKKHCRPNLTRGYQRENLMSSNDTNTRTHLLHLRSSKPLLSGCLCLI